MFCSRRSAAPEFTLPEFILRVKPLNVSESRPPEAPAAPLRFPVKRLPDGRALVNLGSSTRTHPGWNNIDFSWIIRLGKRPQLVRWLHRRGLLSEDRLQRIQRLDPDTVAWDLRRGVPYPDGTFDVVYHCHVLEHIDREGAPGFLQECFRVLKPGGILRIVLPDWETLARNYLEIADRMPEGATREEHEHAIDEMIDQMVIRVPRDRTERHWLIRRAENVMLGDTAKNGALHRWMYDRHSLGALLQDLGYVEIQRLDAWTSRIQGWTGFNLDTEPDGSEYKWSSLYMEARRP